MIVNNEWLIFYLTDDCTWIKENSTGEEKPLPRS